MKHSLGPAGIGAEIGVSWPVAALTVNAETVLTFPVYKKFPAGSIASCSGQTPDKNGEPSIFVNSPDMGSILYAEMLLELQFPTYRKLPVGSTVAALGLLPAGNAPMKRRLPSPCIEYADTASSVFVATKRNCPLGVAARPCGVRPVGKGDQANCFRTPVLESMEYPVIAFERCATYRKFGCADAPGDQVEIKNRETSITHALLLRGSKPFTASSSSAEPLSQKSPFESYDQRISLTKGIR